MYTCEYVLVIPNSKICKNKQSQPREQQCKKQIIIASMPKHVGNIYHPQTHQVFLGVLVQPETHHPAPRRPPVGHPSLSRSAHGSRWRRPPKDLLGRWSMPLVHPGRLTWNLQITHLERKMIFRTSMIMFHVNLQGCTSKRVLLKKCELVTSSLFCWYHQ